MTKANNKKIQENFSIISLFRRYIKIQASLHLLKLSTNIEIIVRYILDKTQFRRTFSNTLFYAELYFSAVTVMTIIHFPNTILHVIVHSS